MFVKKFGGEIHAQCDNDCQFANIMKEIQDGTFVHIYDEDMQGIKQSEEENENL